ncbi:MAG: hypothetical protein IJV26_03370 [Lachnospiraceae bacterium]|nr:hypothetical protein [Lachnospiraceae bacterium]
MADLNRSKKPGEAGTEMKTRALEAEDLFAAIGEVDEELIARAEEAGPEQTLGAAGSEEAEDAARKSRAGRRLVWSRRIGVIAAAAACLVITFAGLSFVRKAGQTQQAESTAAPEEAQYDYAAGSAASEAPMEEEAAEVTEEAAPAAAMAEEMTEEAAPAASGTEDLAAAEEPQAAYAEPAEAKEAAKAETAPAEMAEAESAVQENAAREETQLDTAASAPEASEEAEGPVILVSFDHQPDDRLLQRLSEQYGLTLVYRYNNFNIAAFAPEEELTQEELEALLQKLEEDPAVLSAGMDEAQMLHGKPD